MAVNEIERLPMVRLEPLGGGQAMTIGFDQAAQKLWAIGRYRSRSLARVALLSGDVIVTAAYRWQVVTE